VIASSPPGYFLKTVSLEDAASIADIVNACRQAEIGAPWTTLEETRDELTSPGRDPSADDALVVNRDGLAVGYLQLRGDIAPYTDLLSLVFVRPEHWHRGLSAFLLRIGDQRARAKVQLAPPNDRVTLQVARFAENASAGALFEALDYAYVRTFWMMRIQLEEHHPRIVQLDGVAIRTFDPDRDAKATHAALTEAFEDHWGHVFPSYKQWRQEDIDGEGSGFDPGLWFVAVDGDEIVGAACSRARSARDPDTAEVDVLGVRRSWRGRGVGLALLSASFGAFRRRGIPRAELGVDAESSTGATRLYQRAAMKVAYSWEFWEKELRPAGTDSSI
jgi:mycothiol synthase